MFIHIFIYVYHLIRDRAIALQSGKVCRITINVGIILTAGVNRFFT